MNIDQLPDESISISKTGFPEISFAGSVPIFHQTVSGDAVGEITAECSSRVLGELQTALADFDKKAKTKFVLQQQFPMHKEYKFVEAMVGVQVGIYSLSAVGFDEGKTRAVVLVQYLVRPPSSLVLGGDNLIYLLRRTATGWQQVADVPKCGRVTQNRRR
jgi:hypothetical protein